MVLSTDVVRNKSHIRKHRFTPFTVCRLNTLTVVRHHSKAGKTLLVDEGRHQNMEHCALVLTKTFVLRGKSSLLCQAVSLSLTVSLLLESFLTQLKKVGKPHF